MPNTSRPILFLLTVTAIFGGCTTNVYRTQVDALHTHTEQFQNFLHREQVEAAMHETQAIELIGLQLKAGRLPGRDTLKAKDRAQLSELMDAVREQAAVNWVSLAQYFSTRQRYPAARALYQRVIRSYSKGGDHLYAEYARQALTDMDILALGQDTEQGLVAQPALSALHP
jgi:hypothetical protein